MHVMGASTRAVAALGVLAVLAAPAAADTLIPLDLTQGILDLSGCGQDPNKPPCPPVALKANHLSWTSPGLAIGPIRLVLTLPLPDTTTLQGKPTRSLEFDYVVTGLKDDRDGQTGIDVTARLAGQTVSFTRLANGRHHVILPLTEDHGVDDALDIVLTIVDVQAPIGVAVLDPTITDTVERDDRLGWAGQFPVPLEVPRPVQVTLDVMISCDTDLLTIPDEIGVALDGPLRRSLMATHTQTIHRYGRYRTVVRYQGVAELISGTYHRSFFRADLDARVWYARPHSFEYVATSQCHAGIRAPLPGDNQVIGTDEIISPTTGSAFRSFGRLFADSDRLSLVAGTFPERSDELPPDATLPPPTPVCLDDDC